MLFTKIKDVRLNVAINKSVIFEEIRQRN